MRTANTIVAAKEAAPARITTPAFPPCTCRGDETQAYLLLSGRRKESLGMNRVQEDLGMKTWYMHTEVDHRNGSAPVSPSSPPQHWKGISRGPTLGGANHSAHTISLMYRRICYSQAWGLCNSRIISRCPGRRVTDKNLQTALLGVSLQKYSTQRACYNCLQRSSSRYTIKDRNLSAFTLTLIASPMGPCETNCANTKHAHWA